MSQYEILATVIACLAVLVSILAWDGQRKLQREMNELYAKLQREANDLQQATAELAKRQLELLNREERGKNTARLSLDLFKDGTNYWFRLTNIGEAEARDAEIKILVERPEDNPIVESEYQSKFPAKKLMPGASITLIAAIYLSSPTAFNATLSWVNPDGSRVEEEAYVAL
jgi:hypothetical protein